MLDKEGRKKAREWVAKRHPRKTRTEVAKVVSGVGYLYRQSGFIPGYAIEMIEEYYLKAGELPWYVRKECE